MHYVGKPETQLNLCLNNHKSDVLDRNGIPVCRHFVHDQHIFNKHAKFTLIESITNTSKAKEAISELLKKREDFWIRTLETSHTNRLNHELNPE